MDMEVALTQLRWEFNSAERVEEDIKRAKDVGNFVSKDDIKKKIIEDKRTYDPESKSLDYKKLNVTDLKSNKRVVLPDKINNSDEIKLQIFKDKVMEAVTDYKKDKCDNKGNIINKNTLTREQEDGQNSLKKRITSEDLVIGTTDKSSKYYGGNLL